MSLENFKLIEQDKTTLDLAKMRKALALANAEKALAQNESAELNYKNVILQLMIKYKLNKDDVIQEDGTITKAQSIDGDNQ